MQAITLPQVSPIEAYERFIVRNLFVPWTHDLIGRAQPLQARRVLDLACGTGIVIRSLAPRMSSGVTFVGLDISPSMLAKAEALAEDLEVPMEWHEACATCLPFPGASFELVLCQQGLQFFPDPVAALQEVRRVLAPGGLAVFSVWGPLASNPFYEMIGQLVSRHLGEDALDLPFSLSDLDSLQDAAQAAGLSVVLADQVHLSIQADEPEVFAAMCLRGATAVLPKFAALTQAAQQQALEQMYAALGDAVAPFRQADRLVFDTTANVLTTIH